MHYSPSPNPGWQWPWDGRDGLVTLATGQELGKLGQPWFKGKKKKKPKPLNTKRLGREKELEGWEGARLSPQAPGSAHSYPTPTGLEAQSRSLQTAAGSRDPGPRSHIWPSLLSTPSVRPLESWEPPSEDGKQGRGGSPRP